MRAVAAAVLVLLLAGCAGSDAGDGLAPAPSSTTSTTSASLPTEPVLPTAVQQLDLLLAFTLDHCEGISFQHARSLEDVQALLPAGFVAAPAPDSAAGQVGVLGLDLYRCGNLTTLAKSVPDTFIGVQYTYVQRPTERVPDAPDAPVQEYVFRMLAGSDILATLWPAAGYDTFSGNATMDSYEVADGIPSPVLTRQATVGDDGIDSYQLTASGADLAALEQPRTQAFARYSVIPADGSLLLWTGTYALPSVATGPGVLLMPPGDPFERYAPGGKPSLTGTAHQVVGGAVQGQDLRRIFT